MHDAGLSLSTGFGYASAYGYAYGYAYAYDYARQPWMFRIVRMHTYTDFKTMTQHYYGIR